MPHCCSVPNCNGNYRYGPKVAVFNFPKEPKRLQKWIRAIKRDFKPTASSKVCEKHFRPDDILWEISATDGRTGKTLIAPLSKPRLLENAVPCIFPKYSSHLSCSQCSTKEKSDNAHIGNEAGALEKHDHNYCRMWCEGLQIYSNDDNPTLKEEPAMECKEEPLSDTESHSVELNYEEKSSIPQDVPCKEENLDIKEEIHPLAMVSSVIKTEPQDDVMRIEDEMAVKNELSPLTVESSIVETTNQDNKWREAKEVAIDPLTVISSTSQNSEDVRDSDVKTISKGDNCDSEISKMIHSEESIDSYFCRICDVSFKNSQDFEVHMQIHEESHSEEEEEEKVAIKYTCETCEATFHDEGDFEIHMLEHTNSLVCRKCEKSFKKKGFLINHLRLRACTFKDSYKCHICEKQLPSKQRYKDHVKSHGGDRRLSCHDCGKIFLLQSGLDNHVRTVHSNIRRYCCHVCNRLFTSKSYLTTHLRTHTGERPFSCTICGKSFTQKNGLGSHMALHTGVFQYVCEFCNRSFKKKYRLDKHLRRAKHSCPYQCYICTRVFVMKKDFEKHVCRKTAKKSQDEILID